MPKPVMPPCPVCRSNHHVQPVGLCGEQFICSDHGLFDLDPEEGGLHDDRNPGARMDRLERLERISRDVRRFR